MKELLIVCLILTTGLWAQEKIFTLEESLEIGLKNSKELKISQSKVISSDARITEVSSQMLPRLSFAAGYTRLSDVPPFEVSVPLFPDPIKIQDVILDNYTMKVSLQQPLFTGFKLSSLKSAAENNYTATSLEYDKDINEYAFKIYSAFWNYHKSKLLKSLLEETLDQTAKHLEDTKNFFNNQLVTKNDLLKLEVQYSNIKLQLIEAEDNCNVTRINFNKVLGVDLSTDTDIAPKEINEPENEYDIETITNEAYNNRKEIESLEYRIKSSEDAVTAAQSNWFPSIYLFGDYYYNSPNQRYLPPKDEFNDSWDVGVTLSWDIWNWGYTSSQSTQAEQNLVQVQTSLSQLKDVIRIEVYRAYLNYNSSIEKLSVSRKSVEQAEENYRIIQDKYNFQLATSTDLIDAETSLLQAKTNLNNSLVDFQLAKVMLEKAIGRKIY